jgi:hypothetical protein
VGKVDVDTNKGIAINTVKTTSNFLLVKVSRKPVGVALSKHMMDLATLLCQAF